MSLITKDHLSLTLQTLKTLLSFKADKKDLALKIDRSEVEEEDALELVAELELVTPVTAADGSIYTDENDALYSL